MEFQIRVGPPQLYHNVAVCPHQVGSKQPLDQMVVEMIPMIQTNRSLQKNQIHSCQIRSLLPPVYVFCVYSNGVTEGEQNKDPYDP